MPFKDNSVNKGGKKQFVYFEATEGGMNELNVYTEKDIENLCGWKYRFCIKEDNNLVEWMNSARIGDITEHRLGSLVRLRNIK